MKFKPMNDRLLIKRDPEEEVSKGGILLPPAARETQIQGQVVATGSKVEDVKEGDKVLFGKYAGSDIQIDGVDYVILEEESVLGILE